MIAGGLKSSARFFPPTVRATISKDERFVVVNGEWGLSEWYPAMRKDRNAKTPKRSKRKARAKIQRHTKPTASKEAKSSATKAAKGTDNGDSLHERVEQSLRRRILEHLDAHPGQWFKASALAIALNAASAPTAGRLSELASKGKVAKAAEGYRSLKAEAATVH